MPHERHGERGLQARRIFVRIPDPTMPKLVARLGRRSTIVGLPPSAVPNFAKSLIVVARRGFSDAARRSIVRGVRNPARSQNALFARAPLGCDVSRAGNGMSAMRVLRLSSAARAVYRGRPPFGARRSLRGCSDAVSAVERVFTRHNPLISKSGRLSRIITMRSH